MIMDNCLTVCVCVCVFSSHSFWTSSSLDVPAGVTQEEDHTRFQICVESSTTHGVLEYSTRVCTRLNILIA